MADHLLCLDATGASELPARIMRVLIQRRVRLTSVTMSRLPDGGAWSAQLHVDAGDQAEVELLVKRLNRIVDVLRVRWMDDGRNGARAVGRTSSTATT